MDELNSGSTSAMVTASCCAHICWRAALFYILVNMSAQLPMSPFGVFDGSRATAWARSCLRRAILPPLPPDAITAHALVPTPTLDDDDRNPDGQIDPDGINRKISRIWAAAIEKINNLFAAATKSGGEAYRQVADADGRWQYRLTFTGALGPACISCHPVDDHNGSPSPLHHDTAGRSTSDNSRRN